jgi:putative molybdopterin biosynthesis protein
MAERGDASRTQDGTAQKQPDAAQGVLTPKYLAFPMGKGSGSVTTFSRADGFCVIPRHREFLDEGESVTVQLVGHGLQPVDLVVIGSHCVGLDFLLGRMQEHGFRSKFLAIGSTGGLIAAGRGECDVAGIHLLDPATGQYNRSFLIPGLELVRGYRRLQGIIFRQGDERFEGKTAKEAVASALRDPDCVLVNRNRGSGTRILIDGLLRGTQPPGYWNEARSHNAVAASVTQKRADWGVAISPVATADKLGFLPLTEEHYDFVIPARRRSRPVVEAFCQLLASGEIRELLAGLGFY